ncbi:FAD-dependent oxidoreductase [Novosphingobium flavum]|uniref:FAD-dependent oxidoreductase n=1 Tax=Novosphingobium flavum TaxID=1778672 RepID=A0A7X1KMX9_9SPHN|nr:FAD-dependent oxidoreductase [Novosphingobium flavum]MBC2666838.1 FAD-dependent oxidoreductase [Novosphingobium flavum]
MTARDCDLLVIGSGAAGLSAAATAASLGLDVIVAERAGQLGGTTAWSGGWMWLPRNRHARDAGITEDIAEPRRYLAAVLGSRFDAARVDAFLAAAPEAVDFLEAEGMHFEPGNRICDVYADQPGAGTGGRQLIAAPLDARRLGPRLALLRETKRETAFAGMPIQAGADLAAFLTATRKPASALHAARRVLRHGWDMLRHGRALQLVNGVALVARLFEIADRHGTRWLTGTEATALTGSRQHVTGAVLRGPDGEFTVTARHGVLLATGGFSRAPEFTSGLFPHAAEHLSLAVPEADGAALRLALPFGARFDTAVAAAGAWCPVSALRWPDGQAGVFPHIIDRAKPGVIAVRADGRRFVNEANGYHDYVSALLAATPEGEPPRSWLVCDHRFIRRWGLGAVKPFPVPMGWWLRSGYLKRADSLAALARLCGITPELERTVAAFNAAAREGRDPEFDRGWSPYNRHGGDPALPNPNLAPIERGPFYAVEVVPGSFGSFAGLATDGAARVLGEDGAVIGGLFAAGADAASVMGGFYPSGGINLGPALTFGFIAAREAAHEQQSDLSAPLADNPDSGESVQAGGGDVCRKDKN